MKYLHSLRRKAEETSSDPKVQARYYKQRADLFKSVIEQARGEADGFVDAPGERAASAESDGPASEQAIADDPYLAALVLTQVPHDAAASILSSVSHDMAVKIVKLIARYGDVESLGVILGKMTHGKVAAILAEVDPRSIAVKLIASIGWNSGMDTAASVVNRLPLGHRMITMGELELLSLERAESQDEGPEGAGGA